MAALNFGHTKIAAGVGEELISKVGGEPAVFDPGTDINFPTKQFGISAGIYQGLLENLVLGLDYFRASTTWNPSLSPDNAALVFTPEQTMNFVNVGATLLF